MLADEGRAKAIAFDEIDKAPEEKARGITIATVSFVPWFSHVILYRICHKWKPCQLCFIDW